MRLISKLLASTPKAGPTPKRIDMKTFIAIDQKLIGALQKALSKQELHRIKQGLSCNEMVILLEAELIQEDANIVSYPSLLRAAEGYQPV